MPAPDRVEDQDLLRLERGDEAPSGGARAVGGDGAVGRGEESAGGRMELGKARQGEAEVVLNVTDTHGARSSFLLFAPVQVGARRERGTHTCPTPRQPSIPVRRSPEQLGGSLPASISSARASRGRGRASPAPASSSSSSCSSRRSTLDLVIMGESKCTGKRWEDMETDVLVKIFKELNLVELSPVSQVCRLWRVACSDPLIWGTLDFGLLKSNFIQTRASPYIWVDDRSDKRLSKILRVAMAISRGNVNCMIFHYNLYMKDEHLNYISQRSPHLKRLVMPAWNRISKGEICLAIQRWEELESLTMPTIGHPPYIMEELAKRCKNFKELKVMGSFDLLFASAVTTYLPKLKVLSLRCSKVTKGALLCVLNSMEHLEVLNISHCLLFEIATNGRRQVIHELDDSILERASQLREFHHCQSRECLACQRMMLDEGILRWYRYEDWFWRRDEVSSLDLKDYGRLFGAQCEMLTSVD